VVSTSFGSQVLHRQLVAVAEGHIVERIEDRIAGERTAEERMAEERIAEGIAEEGIAEDIAEERIETVAVQIVVGSLLMGVDCPLYAAHPYAGAFDSDNTKPVQLTIYQQYTLPNRG